MEGNAPLPLLPAHHHTWNSSTSTCLHRPCSRCVTAGTLCSRATVRPSRSSKSIPLDSRQSLKGDRGGKGRVRGWTHGRSLTRGRG